MNSFRKEYKKRKDDSQKLVDEFYSNDEDDQTQEESESEELKGNKIEETKDSGDGNNTEELTEFRQPLQVQSHLEMPGILVHLGHIQRT